MLARVHGKEKVGCVTGEFEVDVARAQGEKKAGGLLHRGSRERYIRRTKIDTEHTVGGVVNLLGLLLPASRKLGLPREHLFGTPVGIFGVVLLLRGLVSKRSCLRT